MAYLNSCWFLLICIFSLGAFSNTIDLSGTWSFRLDPGDRGIEERWFEQEFHNEIVLPGCLQAQGYGNDLTVDTPWVGKIVDQSFFTEERYERFRQPDSFKIPFWLQPDKHYAGAAWYQKTITIPDQWLNQRIQLMLERAHWKTTLWVDDRQIDSQDSLSTPHNYDLSHSLSPGTHRITVRVDNRMIVDVGENAHSISDHTQSNWNGIVGELSLIASDPVWIDDVQVYPNINDRSAKLICRIGNTSEKTGKGILRLNAAVFNANTPSPESNTEIELTIQADESEHQFILPLGDNAPLWDEFNPALHRLTLDLKTTIDDNVYTDTRDVVFGLREFTANDTQFAINGRTTFLRGTLECCIFPRTGYPPMNVEEWKRIFAQCKNFGLNHMRFHSWCPPEAAFIAADESGIYLQVECGAWSNIGDGNPQDEWLYREGDRIVSAYGNHPSFVMLAYGNEPSGKNQERWLGQLNRYWQTKDPRRLYTSASGWPLIDESDFHVSPAPRIQAWGAGNQSRINSKAPETFTDYTDYVEQYQKPVVSHEIGQWCVYPNFEEMSKYTGHLKARNFEIFKETLTENHMGDLAHDFLMASGKLQTICYKEDIESALRTTGFGGFQLLDLHDFPGQGTALIGVLDAFWDEKGYVSAEEYSRFCNSTVPLARMKKRNWSQSEEFSASVEVAHYGPGPIDDASIAWRIQNDHNETLQEGLFPSLNIPTGNLVHAGEIQVRLDSLPAPAKYSLEVEIQKTAFKNQWEFWVYPEDSDDEIPQEIQIATSLDETTLQFIQEGGKALIALNPRNIITPVEIGFSSIFWNTAWTSNQAPHTLGILCDPAHPALSGFPTDYHSDWQWWELTNSQSAAAMVLDDFPAELAPIVQPIDTWFENRRLGLLFEARIGDGKALICSMDITNNLEERLAARQMRASLLRYMQSDAFDPQIRIEPGLIVSMVR